MARKFARKLARAIIIIVLIIIILLAAGVAALTALEYKPADIEVVPMIGQAGAEVRTGEPIKLVSWNIGYGALGDNADFFMDGGTKVYTADEARVYENMAGITEFLKSQNPDIVMLQELDVDSSRSRHIDETTIVVPALDGAMGGSQYSFALNYKAAFVPFPIPPLGKVEGGLFTISRFGSDTANRVSLPCPFSWPVRTVNLKRCLLINRMPIEGSDKELVIINLHLEAYDSGEGKIAQTKALLSVLEEEYAKGNYVIAGGDFNQTFSNVDTSAYPDNPEGWLPGRIDAEDFGSKWSLMMDASAPTCRSLIEPYEGKSRDGFQFYVIDGLIVSDNVKVNVFKTTDLDFKCTDHNPVVMEFVLE